MSIGTLRFAFRCPAIRHGQVVIRQGHLLRGKSPLVARSLKERLDLAGEQKPDPAVSLEVDIGFLAPKVSRRNVMDSWVAGKDRSDRTTSPAPDGRSKKSDEQRQHPTIDAERADADWSRTSAPHDIHRIAKHYGIFRDLFGDAYFRPVVPLRVDYALDDEDTRARVYRGNVVKPVEASRPPTVEYESEADSLWTLVMSTPDGNLRNVGNEYCHWFIGNIPGSRVSAGDLLVDYLRPVPPPGVGYYRYVFVLYKQEGRVDYARYEKTRPCLELAEREWNTLEFYREHQDSLTPAGLAFFQSDWDPSLTRFYHDALQTKEPRFRYDFPKPYVRPQEWFPLRQPFNLYLDKYRDPKEMNKEFLLKKMKRVHPFKAPEPPLKYPNAYRQDDGDAAPSWLKLERKKERLHWGRINDIGAES